jgi:DNA-binding protein H-NS
MSKINGIEKMSLPELKDLRNRVDQAIAERAVTERAEVRKKLEAMAAAAGFSMQELVGATRKVSTVAIKYRNPKDATQTWTGRGRPPRWLAEQMKKGAKKESFLV